jgi:hypothetical protein
LYRHEILKQMEVATPNDLQEERALWTRLTRQLLDDPDPTVSAGSEPAKATGVPAPVFPTRADS